MATYKDIDSYVRKHYGLSVKTCWIAHVKEMNGLKLRRAWNRRSASKREVPCPARFRPMIEEAMRSFGMLK
jgi:hypothetical protein